MLASGSGVSSPRRLAEVKRLKRENAELRRANAILKGGRYSSRPSSTGHSVDRALRERVATSFAEHAR